MVPQDSSFVARLDIHLADAARGGAAHVRELGIARNPSYVATPRAKMDTCDTKALHSVVGFLHNGMMEPKIRIGCETHALSISQGKARPEMSRYMAQRQCALDWKRPCRVALGSA